MLRRIKTLEDYTIKAVNDETVGSVYDFYFDDHAWVIRYLVVDTGTWLPGKRVLISPASLGQPSEKIAAVPVNLTKDQIKNSPDIDTDKPISRQQESQLVDYYQWPAYWTGYPTWGMGAYPAMIYGGGVVPPSTYTGAGSTSEARTPDQEAVLEKAYSQEQTGDPNLRSANEVIDYYIQANDGDIGHVEDFIIDDQSWTIRYMIVDTRNWLPGKKVLVSPQWIKEVSWTDSTVHVDLSRDQIKNSPEYDPSVPIDRTYEADLYEYYGRPKYWA
jgi:hypothetical protein